MERWQAILRSNISSLKALVEALPFDPSLHLQEVPSSSFPLHIPKRLIDKMQAPLLQDPIFLQYVPLERAKSPFSFVKEPVEDPLFAKTPALLQKYKHRCLLITTGACAMHCRYCFRQNYAYNSPDGFTKELDWIASEKTIYEVILSGGDPLSLPDRKIAALFEALDQIEHVKIIRIHSKFLIGIPERVTKELLSIFKKSRKICIFTLHTNHPKELDEDVLDALTQIRQATNHAILLQTVLLKGVNDSLATLKALCEKAIFHGILPYYLHQLDKVEGAERFYVPSSKGKKLIELLRSEVPGYAVFQYVEEIPHKRSKTPL